LINFANLLFPNSSIHHRPVTPHHTTPQTIYTTDQTSYTTEPVRSLRKWEIKRINVEKLLKDGIQRVDE
jgi:hypothetical protein